VTTSQQLIDTLAKDPTQFDLFLVIADLLEEEDNYRLSIAYRWCGENQKRPDWREFDSLWKWYCTPFHKYPDAKKTDHARLPKILEENDFSLWAPLFRHSSFQKAMQALADNLELAGIHYDH